MLVYLLIANLTRSDHQESNWDIKKKNQLQYTYDFKATSATFHLHESNLINCALIILQLCILNPFFRVTLAYNMVLNLSNAFKIKIKKNVSSLYYNIIFQAFKYK